MRTVCHDDVVHDTDRNWRKNRTAALTTGSLVLAAGVWAALGVAVGTPALATARSARTTGPHATTTTVPTTRIGPTVLPVEACASTSAVTGTGPLWVPTKLAGAVPAAVANRLEYYSVGSETLLGPRGWTCNQLHATDGSAQMAVYPPGSPNPTSVAGRPGPGTQLVDATFDYTGHVPGIDLVCPYFPSVATASEPCPSSVPTGEKVSQRTPDVVAITDPAGVKGALAGSGGRQAVTGLMIVPQAPDVLGGVNVAEISCSLKTTSLCPAILSDFVVRQFPVPTTPTS